MKKKKERASGYGVMNLFTSTIIAIVNFWPVTGTRYHSKECRANSYKKEYIYIYI